MPILHYPEDAASRLYMGAHSLAALDREAPEGRVVSAVCKVHDDLREEADYLRFYAAADLARQERNYASVPGLLGRYIECSLASAARQVRRIAHLTDDGLAAELRAIADAILA